MVTNPPAKARGERDSGSIPGSGRFPWSRKWQPTPVFFPGKSHGLSSLVATVYRVARSQTQLSTQAGSQQNCLVTAEVVIFNE